MSRIVAALHLLLCVYRAVSLTYRSIHSQTFFFLSFKTSDDNAACMSTIITLNSAWSTTFTRKTMLVTQLHQLHLAWEQLSLNWSISYTSINQPGPTLNSCWSVLDFFQQRRLLNPFSGLTHRCAYPSVHNLMCAWQCYE